MDKWTLDATIENVATITDLIDAKLEEAGASMKAEMQINIVIDEIFSNIAKYGYASGKGDATVTLDILEDPLRAEITFINSGEPYDPLAQEDPDIHAALDDRPMGGLGILIIKKTMDDVSYEYRDNQNVLKVVKDL